MIISSKKYACETCIKGHRSSSCRHTDRPLFEIKKKGRPVTQCEHCRELRKTKQVHVKCVCESKHSESSQGSKSGFERAAFPNGLPKALEASVALQTSTEPSSSDSDHGGPGPAHRCKSGDPCKCFVLKSRSRNKSDQPGSSRSRGLSAHAVSDAAIMKRIAELRPVLPRPPSDPMPPGGPIHTPSSGSPHAHPQRHHRSAQAPYEVAYGMTHQHPLHHQSYMASPAPSNPTFDQTFADQMQLMGMDSEQWKSNTENMTFDDVPFPSLCGCGDDCNCPGCLHHNRVTSIPSNSAYASCTNPGACGTCLDCTIMSLPASALPTDDTALSIPSAPYEPVAEWLRQVSSDFTDPNSFHQNFMPNNFQQWNQSSTVPLNSPMSPNFNYGSSSPMTSYPNGRPFSQESCHGRQSSMSNFDPRLPARAGMMLGGDSRFLGVVAPPRSRSPSTSSQSSHQGSEGHGGLALGYGPNGRLHGMYVNSPGVPPASQSRRVPSSNGSASSLPHYGS